MTIDYARERAEARRDYEAGRVPDIHPIHCGPGCLVCGQTEADRE
jgi:hypothetical protein